MAGCRENLTLHFLTHSVEIGYNVIKGTVVIKSVVIREEYSVVVNSEELIGSTECLSL
jgi:hypothetical protein